MKNSPRPFRFAWVLGVLLLVASAAGTGWVLHAPPSEGTPKDDAGKSSALGEGRIVCFGLVDVEPGVASLVPVQQGRVVAVPVKEGDEVKAGQELLRLDDRAAEFALRQAKANLGAAEAQLKLAKQAPARHKIQVVKQQAAIQAAEGRLAGANEEAARVQRLFESKNISAEQAQAAKEQVKTAEAGVQVEKETLNELRLAQPELDIKRAEEDVAAKQALVDQAKHALDECTLRAPGAGTVLRVLVREGDVFGPQTRQPAVQFCPQAARIVRAEVEQEFAGRLALGQPALIQDDAVASPTWKGKVTHVADWYASRRSLTQEAFQFNDVRTLECIVTLDADQPPLRINQRVRVTIGQAQR